METLALVTVWICILGIIAATVWEVLAALRDRREWIEESPRGRDGDERDA